MPTASNFHDRPRSEARGPSAWLATVVATGLGSGLSPWAPGTVGSLAALPLCVALARLDVGIRVSLWIAITLAGIWAAARRGRMLGQVDHPSIVIDEFVGMAIATGAAAQVTAPGGWRNLVVAFALFRFFDVVKPPPISWIDRVSKRAEPGLSAGLWVVLDDVAAGVASAAVGWLARHLGGLA